MGVLHCNIPSIFVWCGIPPLRLPRSRPPAFSRDTIRILELSVGIVPEQPFPASCQSRTSNKYACIQYGTWNGAPDRETCGTKPVAETNHFEPIHPGAARLEVPRPVC